jgi:hypothetical protein
MAVIFKNFKKKITRLIKAEKQSDNPIIEIFDIRIIL